MTSTRPENYHIEIMSVAAEHGNSMCVQSCPKCPLARRGNHDSEVVISDQQQELLLELTDLVPDGTLGSVYLYHNVLDPGSQPLRSEILLAKSPDSIRIGCGRIDPANVIQGDFVERVQALLPFRVKGGGGHSPPSLEIDVCFDPLGPDMIWAKAHVNLAIKIAISLRDALMRNSKDATSNALKYRPDIIRLTESWNWLPKNVERSAFLESDFKRVLCENRVQAAYQLAAAVYGKAAEAFRAGSRSGDFRSRVTASVDRAGNGEMDYFAVIASFSSPAMVVDFATRIMDLSPQDGLLPEELLSDEIPMNISVLGDHVWVCHNQAYSRDKSLRFTYAEFRAIMARVARGEGALGDLLRAEIRSRRDRMADGDALQSLHARLATV